MNDELEIVSKEVDVAYSRYYPDIFLESLRKITNISVRIGKCLS